MPRLRKILSKPHGQGLRSTTVHLLLCLVSSRVNISPLPQRPCELAVRTGICEFSKTFSSPPASASLASLTSPFLPLSGTPSKLGRQSDSLESAASSLESRWCVLQRPVEELAGVLDPADIWLERRLRPLEEEGRHEYGSPR